jgi:hypothetical protein
MTYSYLIEVCAIEWQTTHRGYVRLRPVALLDTATTVLLGGRRRLARLIEETDSHRIHQNQDGSLAISLAFVERAVPASVALGAQFWMESATPVSINPEPENNTTMETRTAIITLEVEYHDMDLRSLRTAFKNGVDRGPGFPGFTVKQINTMTVDATKGDGAGSQEDASGEEGTGQEAAK